MIQKIAVIGAGYLGKGIARAMAAKKVEVLLKDLNLERSREGFKQISEMLDHEIERWSLTSGEKAAILERIEPIGSWADMQSAEIVIDATPQDLTLKKSIFREMDAALPANVILSSNTPVLSVTELGRATHRADRVIAVHFLHPPHRRSIVEIVRGQETSDDTHAIMKAFVKQIGKEGIEVFENPGYVTSRLALTYIREALKIVQEGLAEPEDIDKAMRLGFNFVRGPLELADRIGLDEVEKRMKYLADELGHDYYLPPVILRKMVRAGQLGEKTGCGFFKYSPEGKRIETNDIEEATSQ